LLVRGPWVVAQYFRGEGGDPLIPDAEGHGWFPTGDVATIDGEGFMQITDRSKDVIKSGGEWIGSIDLENIAMAHPSVQMAACIAAEHAKWDERPLLIVVRKPNAELTREELISFYEGRIAKWWTPDDVVFVDAIPLGATGKMLKNRLREQYGKRLLEKACPSARHRPARTRASGRPRSASRGGASSRPTSASCRGRCPPRCSPTGSSGR
jgi:fatty-acyl-CoA synthase